VTPDSQSIVWACTPPPSYNFSACISDTNGANYRGLPMGDDPRAIPFSFPRA